jgi:hypothetical protein
MYQEEQMKPWDEQNLIVALAQAYVAKVNCHQNAVVHKHVPSHARAFSKDVQTTCC